MEINENTVVQRSQSVIDTVIDDDTVMMNAETGAYYGLIGVSGRIWELIETPMTPKLICKSLCDEYEVSADKCKDEVMAFLEKMIEGGAIQLGS